MLGITRANIRSAVDRIRNDSIVILNGALRGFIIAFAAILVASTASSAILFSQNVSPAIPNGFLLGITSVAMAAGAHIELVPGASGSAFSDPVSGDIALRLTGMSLVLFVAMFSLVRRRIRRLEEGKTDAIWLFASGMNVAFAATVLLSVVLVSGNYGAFNVFGYVGPLSWSSALGILLFSFSASLFAVLPRLFASQTLQWTKQFWLALFLFYVLALSCAGLVVFAYNALSPDYGMAVPETGWSVPSETLWAGVFGTLLVLPTLIFSGVVLAMGGSAGIHLSIPSGNLSPFESALESLNTSNLPVSISALESLGWQAFLATLAVLIVGALLASAAATKRSNFTPTSFNHIASAALLSGAAAIVLALFTSTTINWTTVATLESGQISEVSGSVRAGISVFAAAALFITLMIGAVSLSRFTSAFVAESVPRVIALLSWRRPRPIEQGRPAQIVGYAVTAVVVLLIALPVLKASVDRVWASIDTPEKLGSSLADELQASDLAQAKAILGGNELTRWLDDKILESGRVHSGDGRTVQVSNNLNAPWRVGNLDATITVAWKLGESVTKWILPTESELLTVGKVLNHAAYRPIFETPEIQFVPSEFMPDGGMTTIEVNGVPVVAGAYAAIPGQYTVTAKGYQLIAPTDLKVGIDGKLTTVEIGSGILLPSGADAKLVSARDAQLGSCKTFDSATGASSCVTADAVTKAARPESEAEPENYFGQSDKDFKQEALSCSANPTLKLISASQVLAEFSCSESVSFIRDFTERSIRVTQIPVYKDVEVTRYVCSDTPGFVSCSPQKVTVRRVVGYENQQTETQGKVFKSLAMKSEATFVIQTVGTLDANGSFVAR